MIRMKCQSEEPDLQQNKRFIEKVVKKSFSIIVINISVQ